jgi:hypothetical protein
VLTERQSHYEVSASVAAAVEQSLAEVSSQFTSNLLLRQSPVLR